MRKLMSILSFVLSLPLLFCACGGNKDMPSTDFSLVAKITAVGDRIEAEIIESENGMQGPVWIITSEDTVYTTEAGKAIFRRDLAAGDVITVYYGGQVMMSYPPQVVAVGILKR